MDCVPRPGAMESKPSPGIGVCGTRGAVREACWGSCAGAEELAMDLQVYQSGIGLNKTYLHSRGGSSIEGYK